AWGRSKCIGPTAWDAPSRTPCLPPRVPPACPGAKPEELIVAMKPGELLQLVRAEFYVLLPSLLIVGGCLLQDDVVSWQFRRAETAFGHEIEAQRLLGAGRSQVLAFLREKDALKTVHATYPTMPLPPISERSKPVQEQSVFRIRTPGVSARQAWCAQ